MKRGLKTVGWMAVLGWVGVLGLTCVVGCAQSTDVPLDQQTGQVLETPTVTEQDSAAQGSQVNIYVINAPGKNGLPDENTLALGGEATPIESVQQGFTNADGTTLERTSATFAQTGVNVTVNTGSTTPSQTGSATGSASGTQYPTGTASASPVQDIKPEASVAVPIAVAPGGIADQQAIATGKGTTEGTSKEAQNELRWAELEAKAEQIEKFLPLIEKLLGDTPAEETPGEDTPADGGDG